MKITTTAGDIWITFAFERDALFAFWGGDREALGETKLWPFTPITTTAGVFSVRGVAAYRAGQWTDVVPGVPRAIFENGQSPTPAVRNEVRILVLGALEGTETSAEAVTARDGSRLLQQLGRRQGIARAQEEIATHQAAVNALE